MTKYNFPMWIHPCSDDILDESLFGWPFATSNAMRRLVASGVFNNYPNIKFITHHCGAMAPYFEGRIKWLFPLSFKLDEPARIWRVISVNSHNDTATYGTTAALMCSYHYFGADHLLFGSDAPLGPYYGLTSETIKSIERMAISDDEKENIFEHNAVNLLKIAI